MYQYHRPPAPQAPGMQAPSTTHIRAGHGMRHMSQVVPGAFYSCVPDSAIGTSLTPMYSNNVMYAPVLVMHCIVCPSTHHSGRAVRRRVLNLQMAAPAAAPIINAITNNFIVWPMADLGPGDDAEAQWAKTLVVARPLDQYKYPVLVGHARAGQLNEEAAVADDYSRGRLDGRHHDAAGAQWRLEAQA